jgi:[ribosomal protein S18]-alanine N-acetyltransferase
MKSVRNNPGIMTVSAAHAAVFTHLHAACFPQAWSHEAFVCLLNMPSAIGFIATKNIAEVAATGFALISCVEDEAEIFTFGVLPAKQRQGVGSHLLCAIHKTCANRGATGIFLEVNAQNTAAMSFYHKAGYGSVGKRKDYYKHENAPADDAIIMRRPLEKPVFG